jgi:UDP-glucose 4-epimerase
MAGCLVTGGAGFIGSHLCERLLAEGHSVTALDNLSSGDRRNIAGLIGRPRFRFLEGEVRDRKLLDPAVDSADFIYHLAATVGVLNIIRSPVETIANNISGTEAVLESAARRRVKVLLTSTSEVYGKSARTPFREDDDLVLGATTKPRWSYAASKIVDEFLALAYLREFGVPTIVTRLFNTIGPRQTGEYGMVVPRFVRQAILGEDLTVYGTGRQIRAFTDVSDVVEWLVRLADCELAVGQVVNLGGSREISIADLAERVIAVTGSRSRVRFVPYGEAYGEDFEDIERRLPDIAKAVALTGRRPSVSLEESIGRIHAWSLHCQAA